LDLGWIDLDVFSCRILIYVFWFVDPDMSSAYLGRPRRGWSYGENLLRRAEGFISEFVYSKPN
jgi:hypothetical protein